MTNLILYSYIYMRMKERRRTEFITQRELKQIIGRVMVSHGGFPRYLVKYVIKDLIKLDLIERLNKCGDYRIKDSSCDKFVRQINSLY